MYTKSEKSKDKKTRTAADSTLREKDNVTQQFGFVDNRPTSISQRMLQRTIDSQQAQSNLFTAVIQRQLDKGVSDGNKWSSPFAKVLQLRPNKIVLPSGRNHYNDGWGARYNIRNDTQLKAEIEDTDTGSGGIDLGWYDAPESEQPNPPDGTRKEKECKIEYRDADEANTTAIYHCGPTGQAHWYDE